MTININQDVGTVSSVLSAANSVGSIVNSLSNNGVSSVIPTALRMVGIPDGAEPTLGSVISMATFNTTAGTDWRVKLSMPNIASYNSSPVLKPLLTTGGLVFPYTPQITINHKANYNSLDVVHNNYPFAAYQGSSVESISITADFYVEDATEAAYWVAAVHYLRSMTKMLYGDTTNAGAPPPVVKLSGYGQYVLNNIPVVITDVQTTMPNDVDYISCPDPSGGGIGDMIGNVVGNVVSNATGGLLGGGSSVTYVPVKSQITVVCKVLYSREQVRKFSLDKFVNGSYVLPEGKVGLI